MRKIKKYPNRRLYDTGQSAYITLEDVRKMISDSELFTVVDAKTGDDITHNILLQIIGEIESCQGGCMLSNRLLANLIRFYGDSLQGVMADYLERSVETFVDQQHNLRQQMERVLLDNSVAMIPTRQPSGKLSVSTLFSDDAEKIKSVAE